MKKLTLLVILSIGITVTLLNASSNDCALARDPGPITAKTVGPENFKNLQLFAKNSDQKYSQSLARMALHATGPIKLITAQNGNVLCGQFPQSQETTKWRDLYDQNAKNFEITFTPELHNFFPAPSKFKTVGSSMFWGCFDGIFFGAFLYTTLNAFSLIFNENIHKTNVYFSMLMGLLAATGTTSRNLSAANAKHFNDKILCLAKYFESIGSQPIDMATQTEDLSSPTSN